MTDKELLLDFKPSSRNGTATVTARLGDELLAVDSVNLSKRKARTEFAAQLCQDRLGIDQTEVEAKLMECAAELVNGTDDKSSDDGPGSSLTADELLAKMPQSARAEADAMLRDDNLMKRVLADVAALGVAGERELAATAYLTGVSRLLDRPLAAIVQGPSSSGKSYVIEKVSRLFPPETTVLATQMTPQALFYMPPGSLSHRFIVAGERSRNSQDEAAEATRALREILSAGRLSKLVTMKINGRMESKLIEQEGPIAFIESTTMTNIFDEDANRCILINTDERTTQTRRIVGKLAAGYTGEPGTGDAQQIIQRHHAMQRMLERLPIVIPYALRLGELFDSDRVEARRAYPQLMSMIQAIVLLHQKQRPIDRDGRLIAAWDDYQLARHLLAKPFARLLGGGLSDPARRYFDRLAAWAGEGEFTTTEAAKHERASRRAVTGWLSELADVDLVKQLEPHKGSKPARWRRTDAQPDDMEGECRALPAVEDVFPNGDFQRSDNAQGKPM